MNQCRDELRGLPDGSLACPRGTLLALIQHMQSLLTSLVGVEGVGMKSTVRIAFMLFGVIHALLFGFIAELFAFRTSGST